MFIYIPTFLISFPYTGFESRFYFYIGEIMVELKGKLARATFMSRKPKVELLTCGTKVEPVTQQTRVRMSTLEPKVMKVSFRVREMWEFGGVLGLMDHRGAEGVQNQQAVRLMWSHVPGIPR